MSPNGKRRGTISGSALGRLARVWIPGACKHGRTRCIHGDEAWARMKVYSLRWWREPVIRRQSCLDCGRALDLAAICVITASGQHTRVIPPEASAS